MQISIALLPASAEQQKNEWCGKNPMYFCASLVLRSGVKEFLVMGFSSWLELVYRLLVLAGVNSLPSQLPSFSSSILPDRAGVPEASYSRARPSSDLERSSACQMLPIEVITFNDSLGQHLLCSCKRNYVFSFSGVLVYEKLAHSPCRLGSSRRFARSARAVCPYPRYIWDLPPLTLWVIWFVCSNNH